MEPTDQPNCNVCEVVWIDNKFLQAAVVAALKERGLRPTQRVRWMDIQTAAKSTNGLFACAVNVEPIEPEAWRPGDDKSRPTHKDFLPADELALLRAVSEYHFGIAPARVLASHEDETLRRSIERGHLKVDRLGAMTDHHDSYELTELGKSVLRMHDAR